MTSSDAASSTPPRVTVLLATHNGMRWLPEQLESILNQRDVSVRVVARDDASTDGTAAWLTEQAASDPRISVLPEQGASGSAAGNFFRLIRQAELGPEELIAFADQDDVWHLDKLSRHAAILHKRGVDGVSSDVTAFTADGTRSLIKKSYPQREFDYLLESPGPGCTFLLSPRLVALAREVLEDEGSAASRADFHDWLVYALCRARGWAWHIDDVPSIDYRQHDSNAMGANVGVAPALSRLALIRQHWHRSEAALLAEVGRSVAPVESRAGLDRMHTLFTTPGLKTRWTLARMAGQLRRRRRDQAIIAGLITLGIW